MRLRYKNQVIAMMIRRTWVSKTNEYTLALDFPFCRDFLEFEYRYNTVWGPPYTSLTNPLREATTVWLLQYLDAGDYIGVNYTHNFSPSPSCKVPSCLGTDMVSPLGLEDMEIDFMGEKAQRHG
jgi:hypothetical protein